MSSPYTVSIVEDEADLRDDLAFQLSHYGFRVECFESAAPFYRYLAVHPRTIAVLDIGLAGEDGVSICRYLREHDSRMGIVFMTARGQRGDRLLGLGAGADAYLVKPVDIEELVLILRRLASRAEDGGSRPGSASADASESALADVPWRLGAVSGFLAAPNGARVRISMAEWQVLNVLLRKPGEPCFHADFAAASGVLPDEYDKHRIEVIFSRLRNRVARQTGLVLPIQAVRGVGYRFAGEIVREE